MTDEEKREDTRSLVTQLISDMPPLAKTVLMWFLMFPIAIAISGMLLQVNVGAIIQGTLLETRENTVGIVGDMLTDRFVAIDARLAQIETSVAQRDLQLADHAKALEALTAGAIRTGALLDAQDARLRDVEAHVRALRDWACDRDGMVGLGSCGIGTPQ